MSNLVRGSFQQLPYPNIPILEEERIDEKHNLSLLCAEKYLARCD